MATVGGGIEPEKFKVFVRYLIQVAEEKRCVTYGELEKVFGLSHGGVGRYAGRLGDYCHARRLPLLNALIIGAANSQPSHGFDWYQEHDGKGRNWGEIVSHCWRRFHLGEPDHLAIRNFRQRDADVEEFLGSGTSGP